MDFFSPWNLMWALPLLGGIVALWMLRLRRQEVMVSSLYLWQSLLHETQANTPFQKLRRNLLLFLQLLVAFLLLFAFARPFVYGRGLTGRTIVLVVDTSASMQATDVRPSRLEAAKSQAIRFLNSEMGGSDVATVIAAGSRPSTVVSFTRDKERLQDAVSGIRGTDTVADMPAALTLALSLVGTHEGRVIRVYSDGAYARDQVKRLSDLNFGGTDVKQVPIGASRPDNVAITALDGRRNPATGRYEVFVGVETLGARPHTGGSLSLLKDGRLIDARELTLAGGAQSVTFDSPLLQSGGLVTARLDDAQDDLAVDNQASLVLPPPQQRRVLLVSPGNLFLERGLNLAPDVTVDECPPGEFATAGKSGRGYALVVFDGELPAAPLPPGNYLVFHAASAQMPLLPGASSAGGTGEAAGPQFVDQSGTHPVMRFVDLSGVRLRQALRVQLAPWGQSLASADSGPIVAAGEHGGLRVVQVAFALSDSDWPIRVSFPIFLNNAVDWLTAGNGLGANAPETPSGGVVSLTVPSGLESVTVIRPDGSQTALTAPPTGGTVVYQGTQQTGVYHARGAGGLDYPFAVDLLSREESALTPQAQPGLTHAASTAPVPLARRAKSDLWPVAAAFALAFLVLEWLVFHRRLS